ncbi:uncharacterized protein LOC143291908 isoform X2 [Babylonia areolata]
MVLSVLQHCPFHTWLSQDEPKPGPDDVEVYGCLTSFTNHVIRIRVKQLRHLGFIVKMAPSAGCPQNLIQDVSLPEERGRTEHQAYFLFNNLLPGCTPTALFYDHRNRILCTQELIGHLPLSGAVLGGHFSEDGARALGTTLASLHSGTLRTAVGDQEFQNLTRQFPASDSMLALIRTWHFERPFNPEDTGRRCHHTVLRMLPDILKDPAVKAATAEAEESFTNDLECVIHGDLHIESVLVRGSDIKLVDAEFCRVGPCAYDLGLLLATLLAVFHRYRHVQHAHGSHTHSSPCCCYTHTAEAAPQHSTTADPNPGHSALLPSSPPPPHHPHHHHPHQHDDDDDDDDVCRADPTTTTTTTTTPITTTSSLQEKRPERASSSGKPEFLHEERETCSSLDQDRRCQDVDDISEGCAGAFGNNRRDSDGDGTPERREHCPGSGSPNKCCRHRIQTADDLDEAVSEETSCGQLQLQQQQQQHLPADDIILKCSVLLRAYTARMSDSHQSNSDKFQRKLLQKIATFTGCELLAWVVGPPHMDFMDSCPAAQRDCVLTAHRLLTNRLHVSTVQDFVRLLLC